MFGQLACEKSLEQRWVGRGLAGDVDWTEYSVILLSGSEILFICRIDLSKYCYIAGIGGGGKMTFYGNRAFLPWQSLAEFEFNSLLS